MQALLKPLKEPAERTVEIDARVRRLQELVDRALSLATGLSPDIKALVTSMDDPLRIAYLLASLLDMKPEDKQKLLEENDLEVKLDAVAMALSREIEVLELKGQIESRAEKEMTDAQRQYVLRQQMKAIQTELGEGDSEVQEIRDAGHRRAPARARRGRRPARSRSARADDAGVARVPDDPHLYRLGARHPVGQADRGSARSRSRRAASSTRITTTSTRSRSASSSTSPCRSCGSGGSESERRRRARPRSTAHAAAPPRRRRTDEGADPVLRRPSRRRQDVARPVDRAGDEPQVRAHLARRRARRSRDSRPPPHLHRLDARPPGAGAEDRRVIEPGADARRDRQDLGRHPGRSGGGAARGARPGAEPRLPRSLPRDSASTCRACSSSPRQTSSARSIRRCSIAWR